MSIKIGTDCSGIEAPIQALLNLKIPFRHVFSSEIDKYCIESIKANYSPEFIFSDITTRNIDDIPNIDLYVAGFPCQPFSCAGKQKGFSDRRGNIFYNCIDVIKNKKPKYFVLENVKGLCKKGVWENIQNELDTLVDYNVNWKILNTKDYGIPQNRERVYIVGIRKDLKIKFEWPEKKPLPCLKNFIDCLDESKFETKRMRLQVPDDSVYIDLNFQRGRTYPNSGIYSPCLNTNTGLWNVKMGRYANCNEYLMLQGFPKTFKRVVSISQFKKQIGNSMSVNVLEEIFRKLIH